MANLAQITARINARLDKRTGPGTLSVSFDKTILADAPVTSEAARLAIEEKRRATLADVLLGLETAALIEFSTIPPYLIALWSIVDQQSDVARSIRGIVHEEMVHLALVSNILVALGGRPRLTGKSAPRYPCGLPGGIHPELTLKLSSLDAKNLDLFIELERPDEVVAIEGETNEKPSPDDKTLGKFYETLREAVGFVQPTIRRERQITGPLLPGVIANLDDFDKAVDLIRRQGEGATGVPFDETPEDLAHYYRFKAIKLGVRLIWDPKRKILLKGDPLAMPAVLAAAPPAGGCFGPWAPADVRALADTFDKTYSSMLDALEAAWSDGGYDRLLFAIEQMFALRGLAVQLMRKMQPDGRGFLPVFRYV